MFVFAPSGDFVEEFTWDGAAIPYLAGRRGDTLVIFSPEQRRLDFILRGESMRSITMRGEAPRGALQYAAVTDDALFVKVTAKSATGYVARLGEDGREVARRDLEGSTWRHAGLLRPWGDSLLSLTGFFPKVDILPLTLASAPDSLSLRGFDSPMLRRTYAFSLGDARGAPLLSSSASPVGDLLFVLNMRPGWLRIDAYDRSGLLQHVLTEEDPVYNKRFYPIDLAARRSGIGAYEIAVAVVAPTPEVRLYSWTKPHP